MIRDAVVRNLEIVGEAVKRLPPEITDSEPTIPWRRIAVLCHPGGSGGRHRTDVPEGVTPTITPYRASV
jgi:hypothetical protein